MMNIQKNFSLKNLNTFGIDVKARFFADIKSEDQLGLILSDNKFMDVPKIILGGGSNILFIQDFDGVVIKNSISGITIIQEDADSIFIKAGAGEIWHDMVLFCVEKNYGGIENLSLIPGTVGAAPIQNIGAYGQEIKDVFVSLEGIFIDTAKKKEFLNMQCEFGYRDSIFKKELKNKFVITSIVLKLSKNPIPNLEYGTIKEEIAKLNLDRITIKNVSDVICNIRKSKLPDPKQIGNAGSFFKNPEIESRKYSELEINFPGIPGYKMQNDKVKIPAAWLIEKCGFKGKRVGNTGTHPKQPLVLVNYGNASGSEILGFANIIKSSVKDKFGILLEEEINIV